MDIRSMQEIPVDAQTAHINRMKKRREERPPASRAYQRQFRYEQYTLDGEYIKTWNTLAQIDEHRLSIGKKAPCSQTVSSVCNGARITHGGYKWKKIPYIR